MSKNKIEEKINFKKNQREINLIFETCDSGYEIGITQYKTNMKRPRSKIPNHPKLENKTNRNQNNKDQIWYKKLNEREWWGAKLKNKLNQENDKN